MLTKIRYCVKYLQQIKLQKKNIHYTLIYKYKLVILPINYIIKTCSMQK